MYGESIVESKRLRVRDVSCFLFAGVFILAVGIVGGILIGIYAYHGGPNGGKETLECVIKADDLQFGKNGDQTTRSPSTSKTSSETARNCSRQDPIQPQTGPQIFAPLTLEEYSRIRAFMIEQGLVTDVLSDSITIQSNYISSIDIAVPKKDDVLRHLDHNAPFPGRFSEVTVVRGARAIPDLMVYKVGPLNEEVLSSESMYQDGDIVFETRVIDLFERREYDRLLEPVGAALGELVNESFDGAAFGDGDLHWWKFGGPPGQYEKQRETRVNAYFNPVEAFGDYNLLDMLPLGATIHCPGNDPSTWYVHSLYYLNQGPYNSTEELMRAYRNNELRKMSLPKGYRNTINSHFSLRRDETQPMRTHATMAPPRSYEPEGPRYVIRGHHVQWMGWDFDVTSRMMRGPALFDIRYKNDRVAYEISLNEISLIYASDSFERSNVVYTDAPYGIGSFNGIIRSVDCPEHSTLLDISFYDAYAGTGVSTKSICIFESDQEEASWRHKANKFYGGLRRTNLIVRVSTVIANYDYIFDFEFRLDGKLYTKSKATGYIQTHFWDKDNPNREYSVDDSKDARDPFGFKVGEFAHGLIHDHMFGFKVDMDVLGTNNSFEMIHMKAGPAVDAFKTQNPNVTKQPDYFRYNVTRYLQYETLHRESGFRLNPEEPTFWIVVNENYRNRNGAKRGYQIAPLQTALQNMGDEHPAFPALSFSKYTCAVTKYNESEQFLDSLFDGFRFDNPKGDLEKMLDNEVIRNEDLVNWVTVGFLHIPTSEDYPMTISLETGFVLKPFNFFDKTDVFDMPGHYWEYSGHTEYPPMAEPCTDPMQ